MEHVFGPKSCQDCPQSILHVIQGNKQRKEFTANFDLTTAKEITSNLERYYGSYEMFQGLF